MGASTLVDMLSSVSKDNQMEWDKILPYLVIAYRSSVQSSTRYTLYMVLFGQEIYLPADVISGVNIAEKYNNPSEYVTKVAGVQFV